MKKETWVVVASSAHARIFRLEGLKLVEVETLIQPDARMAEKDLVSDKKGNVGDYYTGHSSSYSPPHTAKDMAHINFAKKVASHLDQARMSGALSKLYIAAGPAFLGFLRSEMNSQTQHLIAAEIDKDITHLKPEEIKNHFPIGV